MRSNGNKMVSHFPYLYIFKSLTYLKEHLVCVIEHQEEYNHSHQNRNNLVLRSEPTKLHEVSIKPEICQTQNSKVELNDTTEWCHLFFKWANPVMPS